MKQFKLLAALVWYGLGTYLTLDYLQWRIFQAWPAAQGYPRWMSFTKAGLELVLLVGFFILIHFAIRAAIAATPSEPSPVTPQTGEFPSEITAIVGMWLLMLTAVCVLGLFASLNTSCLPGWLQGCFKDNPDITNALATMFGAGVGSAITTILGYLEHASEKKDFERAYAPWYVGRPLMGVLLGLVFYFLLRGGLLAVMPSSKGDARDLSVAGLAGVGALVGLFSKNAIEKLREVFDTLFSTKKGTEQSILDRLPPDLKKQVATLLGASGEGASKNPG
jgi:hypothetical protein